MKGHAIKLFAVMLILGLVAATSAIAGDSSITGKVEKTGTVEKTDAGIVISADDGATYIVMGKDLTEMVGKTVRATGTLAEGKSGKILTVVSVEPVQK